jgi:hypothetical protein
LPKKFCQLLLFNPINKNKSTTTGSWCIDPYSKQSAKNAPKVSSSSEINTERGAWTNVAASLLQCLKAELPHIKHHPLAASSIFGSNPSWKGKISEKQTQIIKTDRFRFFSSFIMIAIYTKQQQF